MGEAGWKVVCNMKKSFFAGTDVPRVYEYFLARFAAGGGEFYTPKSIVYLIAEMRRGR